MFVAPSKKPARAVKVAFAVFVACAAFAAQAASLGAEGARHLLERAGFGATPAAIEASAARDREQAVDRLLEGTRKEATLVPPAFVSAPFTPYYRVREMRA